MMGPDDGAQGWGRIGPADPAPAGPRPPRPTRPRGVLLVVVRAVSFIAAFSPAASPVTGVVPVLRSFCDIGPVPQALAQSGSGRACRPPLCHSSSQARQTSAQSHPKQSLTKPAAAQFSGLADARPRVWPRLSLGRPPPPRLLPPSPPRPASSAPPSPP